MHRPLDKQKVLHTSRTYRARRGTVMTSCVSRSLQHKLGPLPRTESMYQVNISNHGYSILHLGAEPTNEMRTRFVERFSCPAVFGKPSGLLRTAATSRTCRHSGTSLCARITVRIGTQLTDGSCRVMLIGHVGMRKGYHKHVGSR